jgi:hypothetical protein
VQGKGVLTGYEKRSPVQLPFLFSETHGWVSFRQATRRQSCFLSAHLKFDRPKAFRASSFRNETLSSHFLVLRKHRRVMCVSAPLGQECVVSFSTSAHNHLTMHSSPSCCALILKETGSCRSPELKYSFGVSCGVPVPASPDTKNTP